MRPWELALCAALLLGLALWVVPAHSRSGLRGPWCTWLRGLPVLTVVLAAVQLTVEGPRWQLVPAYAGVGLWVAGSGVRLLLRHLRGHPYQITRVAAAGPRTPHRSRSLMRLVAAAAVGAGVIAPPMLFPVFAFPVPSGPYAIGTVTYHWVDASRRDAFVSDPVAHRELIAQVWYPARAGSSAPVAAYVPEPAVLAPLAGLLRLPPFIFGHLNAVTTNARVAAAPAGTGRFPVLICLHGRGGYRQEDTWLVEELVSRGYAVVCLDQPHAASGVDLPDGRRVLLDPRMLQRSFVDAMVPYLAQDVSFTVDRLVALAGQDPQGVLTGRLDLSRVGVFGLSLGGEVAAQACRDEPRLQACVMMDVWMPQDVVSPGLTRPALFLTRDAATMRSEGWPSEAVTETLTTMRAAYAADRAPAWFVTAPGLYHQDFSDAPLLSPLTRTLHVTGPIPAQRAHDITADYTAAFFDVTLRRTTSPLLSSTQRPFPGVSVESRAGTETDGRGLS